MTITRYSVIVSNNKPDLSGSDAVTQRLQPRSS